VITTELSPRPAGLLMASIRVLGLLHVVQALKHVRSSSLCTLTVNLCRSQTAVKSSYLAYMSNLPGRRTSSGPPSITIKIAICKLAMAAEPPDPGIDPGDFLTRRQRRQCERNLSSMSLTSSGMWPVR